MDLLVVIAQIVKDLLGNLNPLRLFERAYRTSFRDVWQSESIVLKIGYVVGVIALVFLGAVLLLAAWQGLKKWG